MAISEQKQRQMRQDLNTIVNRTENRYPVRLSDSEPNPNFAMDQHQKEFHKISDAEKENLKIHDLLTNAAELHITAEQQSELKIKRNRNMNFLFVNQEKWFGDSDIMVDLKQKVEMYEHQLRGDIEQKPEERARRVALAIDHCDKILEGCKTYLDRGRSFFIWRWKRYESVQLLQIRIQNEREILKQIKTEGYAQKYESVASEAKNLTELLNAKATKGKLNNKRVTRNNTLQTGLKNAEDALAGKRETARRDIIQQLGLKDGEADRTSMIMATTLHLVKGCSIEEAADAYKKISKDMSVCSPEEKKEKIRIMETIFQSILDFDMEQLNIKSLDELYGQKFEKCRTMTLLGHDCDVIIKEYKELMSGADKELVNFSDKKFAELVSKRETLEAVSNFYSELGKFLALTAGKPVDIDAMMKLSIEGITQAMARETDGMQQMVYVSLLTIKTQLSDPATGEALFGVGINVNKLLHNEMAKNGVALYDIDEDLRKNKEKHAADNEAIDKAKRDALELKKKDEYNKIRKGEKDLTPEQIKEKREKVQKSAADFRQKQLERDKNENAAGEQVYNEHMERLKDTLNRLLNKENLTDAEKQELKKAQSQIALEVHNRQTDQKVYARNYVDMDIKKKVTYQVMKDLSGFFPFMENLFGQKAKEQFRRLVEKYASKESRKEVMSDLQEYIEQIDAEFDPKELLSDRLSLNMDKYEKMSGMVEAMKHLLKNNPDYKLNVSFEVAFKRLCAASDLYRVKKQIMLDPSYSINPPLDLKNYPAQKENFAKAHMRRMLMVERVLTQNLNKLCGFKVDISDMNAIADNPYQEADRLYAVRLSNDESVRGAAEDGKKAEKKKLTLQYEKLVSHRSELEKKLPGAKGKVKDELLLQIRAINVRCQEISRKAKVEFAEDPEGRIEQAILLIEQERFRVPMDFNNVDLKNIPKERKDKIEGLQALLPEAGINEINCKHAITDKMGYGTLRNWYDDYKDKHLKNARNIRGHANGSIPQWVECNDMFDRCAFHFMGSYHFYRTDAEMREQIEALTFSSSYMAEVCDDDQEAIAYMDSMFREMNLRMHHQMADAFWRNIHGGLYKLTLMTLEDRLMSINAAQKVDMLAAVEASNVVQNDNYGYYLELLSEGEANEYGFIDHEGIMGAADIGQVLVSVHGMINEYGLKAGLKLSPELKNMYTKFVDDYMKDHPGVKVVEAGQHFLMEHPEAWNNKKIYSAQLENTEETESRNNEFLSVLTALWAGDRLVNLFNKDYVTKLTPQELEQYKAQIKDQGYQGYDKFLDALNGGSDDKVVFERISAIKINK